MKKKDKLLFLKNLNQERRISIYGPKKPIAIVYMHDNQNIWFDEEAQYKKSLRLLELIKNSDYLKQFLFVGIDHSLNRLDEYSPFVSEHHSCLNKGGLGKLYLKDLVETIIPYVESKYKCSKRLLIGSSMGGLISISANLYYPEIFSYIGALSTSFFFSKKQLRTELLLNNNYPKRLYLSVGTNELGLGNNKEYIDTNLEFKEIFQNKTNLLFEIIEDGIHDELAWKLLIEKTIKHLMEDL